MVYQTIGKELAELNSSAEMYLIFKSAHHSTFDHQINGALSYLLQKNIDLPHFEIIGLEGYLEAKYDMGIIH